MVKLSVGALVGVIMIPKDVHIVYSALVRMLLYVADVIK